MKKFFKKMKAKSPDLLFVGGILCVLGGTAAACYATFKTKEDVENAKEQLEELKEEKEELSENEYGEKQFNVITGTAVKVGLNYLPAFIIEGVGVYMLTKSHGMLKMNIASLGVALNETLKDFKIYRSRVVADQGEEADKAYRFGVTEEEIVETGDDGVERHGSVKVIDPKKPGFSIHSRFFDASSKEWDDDPAANKAFLIQTQSVFNDILKTEGFVFLNDVYAALGFDKTKAGQQVGWVRDSKKGDGYIDFGITDTYSVPKNEAIAKRRFVNGYENVILLDFNVDGYILDEIGW